MEMLGQNRRFSRRSPAPKYRITLRSRHPASQYMRLSYSVTRPNLEYGDGRPKRRFLWQEEVAISLCFFHNKHGRHTMIFH
ncbi:hypothetical protein JMJ77_0008790, partial [Colletotrichum scovillei]